jgi:hypothetical protein
MLFNRVCELRRTSWGQHEIPQTPTYTQPNPYGAQGYSMYIPVSEIHCSLIDQSIIICHAKYKTKNDG